MYLRRRDRDDYSYGASGEFSLFPHPGKNADCTHRPLSLLTISLHDAPVDTATTISLISPTLHHASVRTRRERNHSCRRCTPIMNCYMNSDVNITPCVGNLVREKGYGEDAGCRSRGYVTRGFIRATSRHTRARTPAWRKDASVNSSYIYNLIPALDFRLRSNPHNCSGHTAIRPATRLVCQLRRLGKKGLTSTSFVLSSAELCAMSQLAPCHPATSIHTVTLL